MSNFIVVGSSFNSPHYKTQAQNVWLTRTLIREDGSWTFLQNERKKESSSLIRDMIFLIL